MDRKAATEAGTPNAPVWLKVLVVLHVLAITIWALPRPVPSVLDGERDPVGTEWLIYWNNHYLQRFPPVQTYLFTTGFWQYWDMFSPNPSQRDVWCDALITYRDGTERRYQYPRIYLLPIAAKFAGERHRKFYERIDPEKNSYLWPVFAERIALINDDPANPPVMVKLRRHWLQLAGPAMEPTILKVNALLATAHDEAADPEVAAAALAEAKEIIERKHEPIGKDLRDFFPQFERKPLDIGYKGQPYADYMYYQHVVDQEKLAAARETGL